MNAFTLLPIKAIIDIANHKGGNNMTQSEISAAVAKAAQLAKTSNPLTPSITNKVTVNFVANAQLAVGGSAAMV